MAERVDFRTAEEFNEVSKGMFPDLCDVRITHLAPGESKGEMTISKKHLNAGGFMHGAAVIALVDSVTGGGSRVSCPEGALGATTIELKCNFMGTATEGTVYATGRMLHGGRTTQVWDAEVVDDRGRMIAAFRCTQMVLWPRK